jgi:hypothetical protein
MSQAGAYTCMSTYSMMEIVDATASCVLNVIRWQVVGAPEREGPPMSHLVSGEPPGYI